MHDCEGPLLGLSFIKDHEPKSPSGLANQLLIRSPTSHSNSIKCYCSITNLAQDKWIANHRHSTNGANQLMLTDKREPYVSGFLSTYDLVATERCKQVNRSTSITPKSELHPTQYLKPISVEDDCQLVERNNGGQQELLESQSRDTTAVNHTSSVNGSGDTNPNVMSTSPLTTSNESGNFSDFSPASTMSSVNDFIALESPPPVVAPTPAAMNEPDQTTKLGLTTGQITEELPVVRLRDKPCPARRQKLDDKQRFSLPPNDLFDRLMKLGAGEPTTALLNRVPSVDENTNPGQHLEPATSAPPSIDDSRATEHRGVDETADRLPLHSVNYRRIVTRSCNRNLGPNGDSKPHRRQVGSNCCIPRPPSITGIAEHYNTSGWGRSVKCQTGTEGNSQEAPGSSQPARRCRPLTNHFGKSGGCLVIENGLIRIRDEGCRSNSNGTRVIGEQVPETILRGRLHDKPEMPRSRSRIRMGVSATGRRPLRPLSTIGCSSTELTSHSVNKPEDDGCITTSNGGYPSLLHISGSCADLIERQSLKFSVQSPTNAAINNRSELIQAPCPRRPLRAYRGSKSMGDRDTYWNSGASGSGAIPVTDAVLNSSPVSIAQQPESPSRKKSWKPAFLQRLFRSPSKSCLPPTQKQTKGVPRSYSISVAEDHHRLPTSAQKQQSADGTGGIKMRTKKSKRRRPLSEQLNAASSIKSIWRSSTGIWNIEEENTAQPVFGSDVVDPPVGSYITTSDSSNSAEGSTDSTEYSLLPISEDEDRFLEEAPWFCAHVPRAEVSAILSRATIGTFLVRRSSSHHGCYALSMRVSFAHSPGGLSHFLIYRTCRGYKIKGFNKEFPSVHSLVTHHTILMEQLPCRLNFSKLVAERCLKWRASPMAASRGQPPGDGSSPNSCGITAGNTDFQSSGFGCNAVRSASKSPCLEKAVMCN